MRRGAFGGRLGPRKGSKRGGGRGEVVASMGPAPAEQGAALMKAQLERELVGVSRALRATETLIAVGDGDTAARIRLAADRVAASRESELFWASCEAAAGPAPAHKASVAEKAPIRQARNESGAPVNSVAAPATALAPAPAPLPALAPAPAPAPTPPPAAEAAAGACGADDLASVLDAASFVPLASVVKSRPMSAARRPRRKQTPAAAATPPGVVSAAASVPAEPASLGPQRLAQQQAPAASPPKPAVPRGSFAMPGMGGDAQNELAAMLAKRRAKTQDD